MRILLALLLILLPINSYAFTSGNILEYLNQQNTQDSGVTLGTMTDGDVCTYTASGTALKCATASNEVGGMTLDCSASPSSASSFTLTNGSGGCSITSGKIYKLILNLYQNTSNASSNITFNGDTGSNYNSQFAMQNGASFYGKSISSAANQNLTYNTDLWVANSNNWYIIDISSSSNNANNIVYDIIGDYQTAIHNVLAEGYYTGSAGLSSITLTVSAGTVTGTATLYQLN